MRASFVNLRQCAEHVNYQLPNDISRVTYLLYGLKVCTHPSNLLPWPLFKMISTAR